MRPWLGVSAGVLAAVLCVPASAAGSSAPAPLMDGALAPSHQAGAPQGPAGSEGPEGPEGTDEQIIEHAPTDADLAAQEARVERLRAEVETSSTELARAKAQLTATAAEAALALERYTIGLRRLERAQAEEEAARRDLLRAQVSLARHQRTIGQWAAAAYRDGASALDPMLATLLGAQTTDQLGSTDLVLRRIGDAKSLALDDLRTAERQRTRAKAAADRASAAAASRASLVADLKDGADAAVQQQQQVVADLESRLNAAQSARAEAATSAAQLRAAVAEARQRAAADWADGEECSAEVALGYPNGQIPLAALCPVWGAPGHRLRADAARALGALSQEYAGQFGHPICITDSYRTYQQQVALKKRKPRLAARPGTSNHGWGTAADLCDGVNRFGSATHEWMVANAPLHGWFLPSWAAADGSKPEPWHFEFAG